MARRPSRRDKHPRRRERSKTRPRTEPLLHPTRHTHILLRQTQRQLELLLPLLHHRLHPRLDPNTSLPALHLRQCAEIPLAPTRIPQRHHRLVRPTVSLQRCAEQLPLRMERAGSGDRESGFQRLG